MGSGVSAAQGYISYIQYVYNRGRPRYHFFFRKKWVVLSLTWSSLYTKHALCVCKVH